MKSIILIAALVSGGQAMAQTQQANGAIGNSAIGNNGTTTITQPTAQAEAQVQIPPAAPAPTGSPIIILNDQRLQGYQGTSQQATQGAVQEQPVSVVQDAPLNKSPVEEIRKKRQEAESSTEDNIAQSLEKARLEDEMRRREKFSNALSPISTPVAAPAANAEATATTEIIGNNNSVQQTNVLQQQQPVQQVTTQPVVEVNAPKAEEVTVKDVIIGASEKSDAKTDIKTDVKEEKVDIRQEIRLALEESKPQQQGKKETYVSGIASFGSYDQVVNVNNSLGWGFAIGMQTPERYVAEGSFLFGDYEIEDICCGYNSGLPPGYAVKVGMRQYNVGMAAKYVLLPGKFQPVIGALLSYVRRAYSWGGYEFRTSDAIDVGAIFGADLQISPNFTIGVDMRYMTNLGYRQNLSDTESFVYSQRRNDPERLDYYTLNLLAKFLF